MQTQARRRGALPCLILVLGVCLTPNASRAFEQTMTCSRDTNALFPCVPGEDPKPVCWVEDTITYHIHSAGSEDLVMMGDDRPVPFVLEEAVKSSFAAWAAPSCAHIAFAYAGTTDDDRVGFFKDGTDQNIVIWQETWPYADDTAYALTSVTFSAATGHISDVDIELNGEDFTWSVRELPMLNEVDLQNTLTHEVGHLVGFDHSGVEQATMFASAPQGETSKRTLAQDDIDGVCAVYVEGREKEIEEGGCGRCQTTSSKSPHAPPPSLLLALALCGAFVGRRRLRRSP